MALLADVRGQRHGGTTCSGSCSQPAAKRSGETQSGIQPSPSVAARSMAAADRPPTQSGASRLHGPRLDLDVLEGEELARERAPARKQRAQRPHRLIRPRAALAHRHADCLEVLLSLAADAHAEDHPSAGHVVEDENSFATTLGCRSGSSTTAAPIVIRSVTAANVDSATTTSRIGLR